MMICLEKVKIIKNTQKKICKQRLIIKAQVSTPVTVSGNR